MSSTHKILPHYTYADYVNWEGKWELIDGIPYAMSPSPNLRHQDTSGNMYLLFRQALEKDKCSKAFLPLDYKITADTIVQPDILIVCTPDLTKKSLEKPPVLVTEILSPSTALKDRNTKFQLYQAEKIPYYLMVDLEKEKIEIFKIDEEGKYNLLDFNIHQPFQFFLSESCSILVDLQKIG